MSTLCIFCQLGFCISLPIIRELIISLLLFNLDFKITTALLIYTNMPVTTRSQTKASKRSLLYTRSTQLSNSSSLDSLIEPLYVYATETSSINIPSDTSLSSQLTVVNLEETQTVPSSSSLDFQTYPDHFEILENPATISNFQVEPTAFSFHNVKVSKILTMEADYEDDIDFKPTLTSSQPVDLEHLLSVFTGQIANQLITQTNLLRDEIRFNESRIVQENEDSKIEVREEINELRHLLQAQQMQSSDNTSLMQNKNPSEGQGLAVSQETVTLGSTLAIPSVISSANTLSATVSQPTDLHAQMMLMTAESFSKLQNQSLTGQNFRESLENLGIGTSRL
jgi:hypothetical protein